MAGPGRVNGPAAGKGRALRGASDDEPTIKPPAAATKAADKARAANAANYNPDKFWADYFKTSDEAPSQVYEVVIQLMNAKKSDDAEAAIKAYIAAKPKQAESWMYRWLVILLEKRKQPQAEVHRALGYAAFLAKRGRNYNDLYQVADMLLVRNLTGPVGEGPGQTTAAELLDIAAQVDPTHGYAPMMSVNLAVLTKDPKRLTQSVDQLLALGWPGNDEQMRKNARKQAEVLAKSLRDDGRAEEADALLAHLPEVEARDLYLRLTWKGEADIDLTVTEPLGAVASFNNPRTVFGGAIVKNGYGNHPEEIYVCPRGFSGDYTAKVEVIYNDPAKPVAEATLEVIQHEGTAEESRQTHTINLADPKPVVIALKDGRRQAVLPYMPPPERPALVPIPKPAPPGAAGTPAPASGSPPAAKPARPPAPIRP